VDSSLELEDLVLTDPLRRKKSRCTGERPICSLCARLLQSCHYAAPREDASRNDIYVSEDRSPARSSSALEAPVALVCFHEVSSSSFCGSYKVVGVEVVSDFLIGRSSRKFGDKG
jgi:hypothetical protein